MAQSGSRFWKIALGVACGIIIAVVVLTVACGAIVESANQAAADARWEANKVRAFALMKVEFDQIETDGRYSTPPSYLTVRARACNRSEVPLEHVKADITVTYGIGNRPKERHEVYVNGSDPLQPGECKPFETVLPTTGTWPDVTVYPLMDVPLKRSDK